MQKPFVRIVLVLLALAACAAAGYALYLLDRDATAAREASRTFETRAAQAASYAAELRAAQRGYVAHGQGEQFWMTRVTALTEAVERDVVALSAASRSAEAASSLDAVSKAVADFRRLDASARSFVGRGERLLASDLVFGEGLEILKTVAGGIEEAKTRERDWCEREAAAARVNQVYVLMAAAGAMLAVLVLLAATPRRGAASVPQEPGLGLSGVERAPLETPDAAAARLDPARGAEPAEVAASGGVSDVPAREPADGVSADATEPDHAAPVTPPPSRPAPADAPPAPAVSPAATVSAAPAALLDAARLCADLARVGEAQELPGLLQRAASLLDATGIIVWLQDATGAVLRPVVSHGYPPSVMSRLQAIPREAENATAASFRSGELRLVASQGTANGALVAPLVGSTGPVGAMSVEIRNGRESDRGLHALAVLIASQMATLVAGTPQK